MKSILPVAATAAIALFALVGCSSGTGTGTGDVSFVLTDAASDELTQFEVDVSGIVLTKQDGSQVSVMPRATRIDFADLTSVGELVTTANIPSGSYTSMTMSLDFSTATVVILGQSGPATVLDTAGVPITTTLAVTVDFAVRSRPVVRIDRHHMFALDLDLDQAVTVDSGANEVRFSPVISAEIDPSNPRPIATSGIVTAVDTAARTLTVERRALDGNAMGTFTVRTANITVFQIDGVVSTGSTGLAGMVAQVGQRAFVQGTLTAGSAGIDGFAVEVGSGVFGNGQDWVLGHVTARSAAAGNDTALTVVGRSFDVGTNTHRYNTSHTVNVSLANTKVLRRGAGNSIDSDSINVGQLVLAFGDLTTTTLDATAGTGVVRLLPTRVFGIAAGAASGGRITLDVARFDRRNESAFNFTVATIQEADRNAYTVDVGTLDTSDVTAGSKLVVTAWINAVGIPGDANCQALSVVDRTSTARAMLLQWSTPSSIAIASSSATQVTLNIAGASIATVTDGFVPVAVTSSPAPVLQPAATVGIYRLVLGSSVGVHFTFDTFRTTLQTLEATHTISRIAAIGTYDDTTQTFSAATATVVLQ